MATPTQTPEDDKLNPADNPGDSYWNDETARYNTTQQSDGKYRTIGPDGVREYSEDPFEDQEESKSRLQRLEEKYGGHADIGYRAKELANNENKGDTNWDTNIQPQGQEKPTKNGVNGLKKNAVAFGMIGLVFSVMVFLFGLINGALGLVDLKEKSMLSKANQRLSTILEKRAIRVQYKKFAGDMTSGVCTAAVKVNCRYRGFSQKEINKYNTRNALKTGWMLEKTGTRNVLNPLRHKVQLVKIDLSSINSNTFDPSKPSTYTVQERVNSNDFKSKFSSDAGLRESTRNFYKSRVEMYSGKVAKGVWLRTKTFLGKRTTSAGEGNSEKERQEYRQRELARTATSGEAIDLNASGRGAGAPGDPAIEDLSREADGDVKKGIETVDERAQQLEDVRDDYTRNNSEPAEGSERSQQVYANSVDKVRNLGGGIVGAVAGNPLDFMQGLCVVKVLVALSSNTRAISQAVQLIRFAAMYNSTADRIKAGDADGETSQQIGDLMTTMTTTDADGRSAFDSFGYNWMTTGAVRPLKDEDIYKYQNGGNPPGVFGSVTKDITDQIPSSICTIAFSTEATIVAVGLSLIPGVGQAGRLAFGTVKQAAAVGVRKAIKDKVENQATKDFVNEKVRQGARVGAGVGALYAFYEVGLPPLISSIARASKSMVITGDEFGLDAGNAYTSGIGAMNSQVSKSQGLEPLSVSEVVEQDKISQLEQQKIAKEEGVDHFDLTNPNSFSNTLAVSIAPTITKMSSINTVPLAISGFGSAAVDVLFNKVYADENPEVQYKFCQDERLNSRDVAGDPFCNPQFGMSDEVLDGINYDPEKIVDYLYSYRFITDDGSPTGEFQDFIDNCMNTNIPLGEDEYEERCTKKNDEKYTMMRLYCIDSSIDNDMNEGEGTGCAPNIASQNDSSSTPTNSTPSAVPFEGSVQDAANVILSSGNVTISDDKSILESAARGEDTVLDDNIIKLIAALSKEHTFTISSLFRGPCSGSNHCVGKAVDINPTIDGVPISYSGHNEKIQKFIDNAAKLLGSSCENGVPNNTYVTRTKSNGSKCDVFVDKGTGPHIHLAVSS